jgi:hypothetical protein
MGLQPIEKTIGGEVYTFTYLPPRIALSLLAKIVKVIGPAIGMLADEKKEGNENIEDFNIGNAAKMLCDRLDEDQIQTMINTLMSQITHKGHGDVLKKFDMIFTGRIKHLFLVVKAALEVQYADFFDGKNVIEGLRDLAKDSTQA